jgi:hypothetical protein
MIPRSEQRSQHPRCRDTLLQGRTIRVAPSLIPHLRPHRAEIQSPMNAVTTAGKKTLAVARPSWELDGLSK